MILNPTWLDFPRDKNINSFESSALFSINRLQWRLILFYIQVSQSLWMHSIISTMRMSLIYIYRYKVFLPLFVILLCFLPSLRCVLFNLKRVRIHIIVTNVQVRELCYINKLLTASFIQIKFCINIDSEQKIMYRKSKCTPSYGSL